ncbi:MAG: hypothetical protein IPO21_02160 [Bacteroidales bacterium]|nr:hypothetical protein [Bacteroidales bacterium]
MHQKELETLIRLLDDPDDEVYNIIKLKLHDAGTSIIKKLEKTWEIVDNPLVQERIEEISHQIQFSYIYNEFSKNFLKEENDIFNILLLISKFHFPEIDIDNYKTRFYALLHGIEAELTSGLTPLEKIKVVDHIVYQEYKISRVFSGQKNPDNYLLSSLLTNNKGNSLALTLFYLAIGQKLNLPLYAVNLPDNFALAYLKMPSLEVDIQIKDVLFYINPGNRGAIFSRIEIDEFLKKVGKPNDSKYYLPISTKQTIKIYMNSLHKSYYDYGNKTKAKEFARLLSFVK